MDSDRRHSLRLPGGDWTLWRTAALRGAGFPASLVLALRSDRAAAAADAYIELPAIREQDVVCAAAGGSARISARATRRMLKREAREAAHAALVREYESDTARLEQRLREILANDRFREAAIWQNRDALAIASRRLNGSDGAPSERRRAAELIAMLVQRYAAKNDSVGFFGPVGWISFVDLPITCECTPGPTLTKRRRVYFEWWAIDALIKALNERHPLTPWTMPRLKAGAWLSRDEVYAPEVGRVDVSADDHRLLRLCDGRRTAREIAAAFVSGVAGAAESEADVFAKLKTLVRAGLLIWNLEVAPQRYPECELRARLERIGDPDIRHACLTDLQKLVTARDRAAEQAGDATKLDAALQDLETTFTTLTGSAATRRPGEIYAARKLVYEDCQRACDVTIGSRLLERLGPPLSIVLSAARWASVQWRQAFTRHLKLCHAQLRERYQTGAIDAEHFVSHVIVSSGGAAARAPRGKLLTPVLAELRERVQRQWHTVLSIDARERHVTYSVADVSRRAAAAFDTRECGSWAGYFSPDVLVCARGVDALRRGDCHFVLGELHSGNTILSSALSAQHPDPESLRTAAALDTSGKPALVFQYPKSILTSRIDLVVPPTVWRYESGDDLPGLPPCRSLPAAQLLAVDDGDIITLRSRDGSFAVDAYDQFAQFVHHEISELSSEWLPVTPHSPRVTIGDLTVMRERWHATADDLTFLAESDRALRFARFRAWARERGMPRQMFCRFPFEAKPSYLDVDSIVYTDIFLKMAKRLGEGQRVRMTEMLPGVDDTWLVDAHGMQYTCELRLVARIGECR